MTLEAAELEVLIRGTYINVPPARPGLCRVCTVPTSGPGWDLCLPCQGHSRSGYRLARDVIPLGWSPKTQAHGYSAQSYTDLSQYKEPSTPSDHLTRLRALMSLAFNRHGSCILPDFKSRPFAVSYVPSTSGRPAHQPAVEQFVKMFAADIPRVVPAFRGQVGGDRNARRAFAPNNWEIPAGVPEEVERVLIIDDTWVTGGHAQSVAAAFELAGMRSRVVVLGRALDPNRTDQGSFLRAHPSEAFDSFRCPVHRVVHKDPQP